MRVDCVIRSKAELDWLWLPLPTWIDMVEQKTSCYYSTFSAENAGGDFRYVPREIRVSLYDLYTVCTETFMKEYFKEKPNYLTVGCSVGRAGGYLAAINSALAPPCLQNIRIKTCELHFNCCSHQQTLTFTVSSSRRYMDPIEFFPGMCGSS